MSGGSLGAAVNCYTTVPPGELAWFGDDNKPCEQSSLHYSSKTQGSAASPVLTLASILTGSHAFPRAGQAFNTLPVLPNSSQSIALCLDQDSASATARRKVERCLRRTIRAFRRGCGSDNVAEDRVTSSTSSLPGSEQALRVMWSSKGSLVALFKRHLLPGCTCSLVEGAEGAPQALVWPVDRCCRCRKGAEALVGIPAASMGKGKRCYPHRLPQRA